MPLNRGVVYLGHNKVEVQSIDFPTMKNPAGKEGSTRIALRAGK